MSKILEESLKNGAISQEKFDELSAKGDYDSFREVFGGSYTGTLGEYQYIMGSKDEKWYSLKKIADTAMQILGGVVAVVGVISIFVTAGATLPFVIGAGSVILGAYGSVKYGYQFITEKDWMTGRDLSDEEKWLSGLQAIASMITLGRGVGLAANAMSQAKGASEVVKNTAKFFAGKNVDRVLTVADYAVDGFVAGTKIYYGQPIDQVLFDTALALGVNFAISKGMKNLKKYATENDLVYNVGRGIGTTDFTKMSDEEFLKYLKDNNLSFSDVMDSKDAQSYNKYWDSILHGTHLPPNVNIDDYKRMLLAQGKLNELEALKKIDFDEVLQMRIKNKGTGSVPHTDSKGRPLKLTGEEVELDWLPDKYKAYEIEGTVKVNGQDVDVSRRVYQQEVDFDYVPSNSSAKGMSNRELMESGRAPYIIDSSGRESVVELHHLTQTEPGGMFEISEFVHDDNTNVLHGMIEDGSSFRNNPDLEKQYNNFRRNYWKWRSQN